jgi:hypothetical protein
MGSEMDAIWRLYAKANGMVSLFEEFKELAFSMMFKKASGGKPSSVDVERLEALYNILQVKYREFVEFVEQVLKELRTSS